MTDDVKFNMKKLVTLKRFTTLLDDDSNIEVNYDKYQYYYQYIIFHSLELFSLKSGYELLSKEGCLEVWPFH